MFARLARLALFLGVAVPPAAAASPGAVPPAALAFLDAHCAGCHGAGVRKGGLDLDSLARDLRDGDVSAAWARVHDRVRDGEMPPKSRPPGADRTAFLASLAAALTDADRAREAGEGRATRRRLNASEYEDTLRDLLDLPDLRVREFLPADGEAHLFAKSGDALDVSHVHLARYLDAADFALRQARAPRAARPATAAARYYARDQRRFYQFFRAVPVTRQTFPVLGTRGQPDVQAGKAPRTAGPADPATREQEAVGVVVSTYEAIEVRFDGFTAPVAGRYRLRLSAYSLWVGTSAPGRPWVPDYARVSRGRRPEPVVVYAQSPQHVLRRLGAFDAGPDPTTHEMTVWLDAGETVRPDAARLFRARPGEQRNPLAEPDGMPGVAFRWLEAEGPLYDRWPPTGHRRLFGDLPPARRSPKDERVEVVSRQPDRDARALLRAFLARAYRRPAAAADEARFLAVARKALADGQGFADAMTAAYTAVLASPQFLYLDEPSGELDGPALAARLSYFLWNSSPDAELRRLAASGELRRPAVLRAQADRLLDDPKSGRFVTAFLDDWLDLRELAASAPDAALYPEYQLDDLLVDSMAEEPRRFFAELVARDLGARHVIDADFAFLNERLAAHYGLPGVAGVGLRRVALPPGGPRGGLMTQAAVLKVTANGTTTSPVVRGAWVTERLLGKRPPPPPADVPAVEPDTRGATTIRELLAKHRSQASCASCHRNFDPPGFALESFDPMGAWRDRYRVLGGAEPVRGSGHNGYRFAYSLGPPVDPSGTLPDGRPFRDVRELKRRLLADEAQVARNLVGQLVMYATGVPVRFADRPAVEGVLARAKAGGYGVRTLIHELVQSDLFRSK